MFFSVNLNKRPSKHGKQAAKTAVKNRNLQRNNGNKEKEDWVWRERRTWYEWKVCFFSKAVHAIDNSLVFILISNIIHCSIIVMMECFRCFQQGMKRLQWTHLEQGSPRIVTVLIPTSVMHRALTTWTGNRKSYFITNSNARHDSIVNYLCWSCNCVSKVIIIYWMSCFISKVAVLQLPLWKA